MTPERTELYGRLEEALRAEFGDGLIDLGINYDILQITVPQSLHHKVAEWAKTSEDWSFNHFIDITGVDQYTRFDTHRFEVVVHLRSHKHNLKFRIVTRLDGDKAPTAPTLTDLYAGADWSEREVYDLMGITFTGHPRMTRIMNPDDFVGHPLRKDFPVKGQFRGSFPKGTVINNKRREPVVAKQTKPRPADQVLPRTPWEQRREPLRKGEPGGPLGEDKENGNA